MKIFIFLFGIFFSLSLFSQDESNLLGFGHVDIADSRIPLDINHFFIQAANDQKIIKASFIGEEVTWVRTSNNLLSPRARFFIKIQTDEDVFIKYDKQTIIPTRKGQYQYVELFTNLFNPKKVTIFLKNKKFETLIILSNNHIENKNRETMHIDYSCVKYSLSIEGLDNEYLSVGCKMRKTGTMGNERPRLEVSWMTTNFHMKDAGSPPYTSFLLDNSPIKIKLYNNKNQTKIIKIRAKLPKRLYRLKTAIGFGPYTLHAKKNDLKNQNFLNPAAMIYAKYSFNNKTSLRAFDALVMKDSIFNNFGLYYAYELANLMNERISIIPLLGAQGLSTRFDNNDKMIHRFIFPQGVEINYHHAFGLENYSLVLGLFLSTSSSVKYENFWIRFGKSFFAEINYIRWAQDARESKMVGLSIGIPFMRFW